MTIKKRYLISIIFSFFVSILISIVIANRDIASDGDTLVYMYNFDNMSTISNFRYEFLFDLIGYITHIFTDNYIYYFFVVNILLNIFLLISAYKISFFYNLKFEAYIPIFFSIILLSSWYETAAFNGLRQGMALALLYVSIIELILFNKRFSFCIIYLASCFLHYSNFLLFPFIFLKFIKIDKLFILSILVGIFYLLNINEYIVKFISEGLRLPLYSSIKGYVEDSDSYRYGFQWDLFLYTIGLSSIFYSINKYILENKINHLVQIYLILTIPYYLFGFAAFSNRYGLPVWFFSIFLDSVILYLLFKKNNKFFLVVFALIIFSSILYFLGKL